MLINEGGYFYPPQGTKYDTRIMTQFYL